MPEIIEVLITAEVLNQELKDFELIEINFINGRYLNKPFDYDLIKNKKIIKIASYGKFMYFNFENDTYLFNTFGLTGKFSFNYDDNEQIKINLLFKNNDQIINLYFYDKRGFGWFKIGNNKEELNKILLKKGPDILQNNFSNEQFINLFMKIKNKNINIVKALMDQKKLFCGLGNYLVAELLYLSKINPFLNIKDLSEEQIINLYDNLKQLLVNLYNYPFEKYIKKDIIDLHLINLNPHKYFPEIINIQKYKFNIYQRDYDDFCNEIITKEIIKDRLLYYCPNVQLL